MVGFGLGEGSGSGFGSLEDWFGSSKSEMGLHYNYPIKIINQRADHIYRRSGKNFRVSI